MGLFGIQFEQNRFERCLPSSPSHDSIKLTSDYNSLWDTDRHRVLDWRPDDAEYIDLLNLNETSEEIIKHCEAIGFPQPCLVQPEDPKFGGTKFILTTTEDWKGEKIFYNIIKEKLNDKHNYIKNAE